MINLNYADEIKEKISTADVFERYGYAVNSKGFVCCPFHQEKTPSMKVYKGNNGYYCFGCGASGDIFTFVMKLFDLSFNEAVKKLNDDFYLNVIPDRKLTRLQRLEQARQTFERKKAINKVKAEENAVKQAYNKAYDEFSRLQKQYTKYKPKQQGEPLHPLFVEALQNLETASHKLEVAEMELLKNEREH